jgi:hypothetical protein
MIDPLKYSYYLVLVTEKKKNMTSPILSKIWDGKSWKTNLQPDCRAL